MREETFVNEVSLCQREIEQAQSKQAGLVRDLKIEIKAKSDPDWNDRLLYFLLQRYGCRPQLMGNLITLWRQAAQRAIACSGQLVMEVIKKTEKRGSPFSMGMDHSMFPTDDLWNTEEIHIKLAVISLNSTGLDFEIDDDKFCRGVIITGTHQEYLIDFPRNKLISTNSSPLKDSSSCLGFLPWEVPDLFCESDGTVFNGLRSTDKKDQSPKPLFVNRMHPDISCKVFVGDEDVQAVCERNMWFGGASDEQTAFFADIKDRLK